MSKFYVMPDYYVSKKCPELLGKKKTLVPQVQPLDLAYYSNVRIKDICEELGLETYDSALPQDWCDDVKRRTGKYPAGHMVFCYDKMRFGEPIPITREGKAILEIYNHLTTEEVRNRQTA